ncbi:fungal-specific transcription factor domain-containing protein [Aspergillus terricola var. indicus]
MFPSGSYQDGRNVKRKRVGVACNPCRAHKIRCDGVRPNCGTCLRRREKCGYGHDNIGQDSELSNRDKRPRTNLDSSKPQAQEQVPVEDHEPEVTAMGLTTRPLGDGYKSQGAFFGDSSAIAFIQQLQETLKSGGLSPEPSRALDTTQRPFIEKNTRSVDISLDLLPPRALADHLVDCYFTKIHTLYPFVHKEAFLSLYQQLWTPEDSIDTNTDSGLGLGDSTVSSKTFYYGLNIVFAHGCQFSEIMGAERQTTSEAFFYRCKPALDVDYLERGDLALVQVLLFIAHYLQGSQTPDRCWHAIGTACRLAQGLGLHATVGDEHRSFAQKQMRRRVWHGCRMLDLATSIMLGRPAMTSKHSLVPLPEAIDDCYLSGEAAVCRQPPGTFSRVEWFVATLKLHELLRKMHSTLYEDETEHHCLGSVDKKARIIRQAQFITQIELDLDEFRVNVPKPLSWEVMERDQPDPLLREKCLLKARFLYLRLLAYRPALSQSLGEVRDGKEDENEPTGALGSRIYSDLTFSCSVLCVQTAIELISLVHETCSTDLASVWFYNVFYTFTAGLVLILAEFHSGVVKAATPEALDAAWERCQWVLNYLGTYSVVAERCFHSLNDTRSKCLKMRDPNSCDGNALQTSGNHTSGLNENEAANGILSDSLFADIDVNNVALDWSWFDISY